jgi:hypothetical protein
LAAARYRRLAAARDVIAVESRDFSESLVGSLDTAADQRLWRQHRRLVHFLVAFGVAFPRVLAGPYLHRKVGASDGVSMVLECLAYFMLGTVIGAIWYVSREDTLTAWLGYSSGQFVGCMVLGTWNWFIVYTVASMVMALIPATGDLVGGTGRKLIQRATTRSPTAAARKVGFGDQVTPDE